MLKTPRQFHWLKFKISKIFLKFFRLDIHFLKNVEFPTEKSPFNFANFVSSNFSFSKIFYIIAGITFDEMLYKTSFFFIFSQVQMIS